ncbi:MAG: hypothetical protein H5U17_16090, partial [Defluviimonas sp.]|nr:hypothetical protein [Defluviimonas sp.]
FKTEVIKFLGPWKSVGQVEWETLQWVSWYDNERLHSAIGQRPPQEVEEAFHEQMNTLEKAAQVLNRKASRKPGAVQAASQVMSLSSQINSDPRLRSEAV